MRLLFHTDNANDERKGADFGFGEIEWWIGFVVGMTRDGLMVVAWMNAFDHWSLFGVDEMDFSPLNILCVADFATGYHVATGKGWQHGVACDAYDEFGSKFAEMRHIDFFAFVEIDTCDIPSVPPCYGRHGEQWERVLRVESWELRVDNFVVDFCCARQLK